MTPSVRELVELSRLNSPERREAFHNYRKEVFDLAQQTFDERALTYNADGSECMDAMSWGIVSLASEINQRNARMLGILSPWRSDLTQVDLNRLCDLSVDLLNFLSWMYACTKMAGATIPIGESGGDEGGEQ